MSRLGRPQRPRSPTELSERAEVIQLDVLGEDLLRQFDVIVALGALPIVSAAARDAHGACERYAVPSDYNRGAGLDKPPGAAIMGENQHNYST